jgi:GTP-binding protein LepA
MPQGRTTIIYEMPLAEMVTDFYDHLKSRSKGYASMEYSLIDYRQVRNPKSEIRNPKP